MEEVKSSKIASDILSAIEITPILLEKEELQKSNAKLKERVREL